MRALAYHAFIANNCSPPRTCCDNDVHSTAIFTCKPYTELQLRYQLTHLWHVACRLSHVRCRDRHQCRLSPHRFWVGSPTSTSLRTVNDDTANHCHCLRMLSVISSKASIANIHSSLQARPKNSPPGAATVTAAITVNTTTPSSFHRGALR